MDLGTKFDFFWSPKNTVSRLIKEWNPEGCASERECEDSLYLFLHARLDDKQIIRQYGKGRARVDLMVDDKVMVELKYALTSTSEYQRLVGQLVEYKDWHKDILVVLVGETEPSLLKQLQRVLEKEFSGITSLDNVVELIQK